MAERARTPILHALYHQYVADQDCARYGDAVLRRYTIGTLERLTSSGDRTTRRASVLALGLTADYHSNAVLAQGLHDPDRGVRMLAETGIQQLWHRAGTPRDRKRLKRVTHLIAAKRFVDAIARATQLIEEVPWLAESWNQRAIALFGAGQYADSVHDCHQALQLNPHHFGAAAGMGHCHLKLNNRPAALECFRRALRLNPNLEGVRAQVLYLQRTLKSPE